MGGLKLCGLFPRGHRRHQPADPDTCDSNAVMSKPPPPPVSSFLELPVDIIVYLIRTYLSATDTAALSLVCKATFNLLFPESRRALRRKEDPVRAALLELLEKDMGADWWYCSDCKILHPISIVGSTIRDYYEPLPVPPEKRLIPRRNFCFLNRRRPFGSIVSVDYPTIRLVMNRHLHGAPIGLPLEIFNVEPTITTVPHGPGSGVLPWEEQWSARIRQNELLLSVTRTVNAVGRTDDSLYAAMKVDGRELCGHVSAAWAVFALLGLLKPPARVRKREPPRPSSSSLPSPSPPPPPPPASRVFSPLNNVLQSCAYCCTDYVTTVERRQARPDPGGKKKTNKKDDGDAIAREEAYWHISITTYHRLGGCRSHFDPIWQAFVSSQGTRPHRTRNQLKCPPGDAKAMWESQE